MRLKTRIFIAKALAKKHYAGAMDAMKSLKGKAKTATLKGLSKGKTIASKTGTKAGNIAYDIGRTAKQFPGDAVKEFKGIKRTVKRTAKKLPETVMKYPIATGAVIGGSAGLAIRNKKQKKQKKG